MRFQLRSGVLLLLLAFGFAAGGGCVDQPMIAKTRPAPAVLSPDVRAQLARAFDVRAAERFFQTMSQADANRVLIDMGVVVGQPPAETRHVTVPVSSTDPAVQAAVDAMWAPSRRITSAGETPVLQYPAPAAADSGRRRP
jgi:hypothetical protein